MSDGDRLGGLRELGESAVDTVLDRVGRGVSKVQERRPLSYDLLESDDAYLVVFDTPGVSNTDLQVQFREGAVEVRVDRFRDFYEGFEMVFPGRGLSLDGRAELPEDAAVDPQTADATLTDYGTLEVRVPKADDDEGVTIDEDDDSVAIGDDADDGPVELDPEADAGEESTDSEAGEDEADGATGDDDATADDEDTAADDEDTAADDDADHGDSEDADDHAASDDETDDESDE